MKGFTLVLFFFLVAVELIVSSQGCTEGEHWKDVCRDCRCTNGLPMCTMQLCPGEEDIVNVSNPSASTTEGCKPGEKWKEDCNECICDNSGQPECSRRLCA